MRPSRTLRVSDTVSIFVTGAHGRLGSELIRIGCIPVDCDVTVLESVQEALSNTTPEDVLIHTAAYSDVDGCESVEGTNKALKVNMWGTEYVRQFHKGRMILISTDYIFSGKKGPYDERPRREEPVNAYGFTKWTAEIVFQNPIRPGDTIVRTTGLYGGPSKKNDFAQFVRDNLRLGADLDIAKDLRGNQTYVPHLADALIHLVDMSDPPRVINLASIDIVTRYEFALMIASYFGLDKNLLHPVEKPQNWIAKRPTKGGLKVKLAERLGFPIYKISEGLQDYRLDGF